MKRNNLIMCIMVIATGCSKSGSGDSAALPLLALAGSTTSSAPTYNWNLPLGWPTPVVPSDNPMTAAKVTLGRYLFYDKRLSGNQKQACASCHIQSLAFSDGRPTGLGSTGEYHPRSPQQLDSPAYNTRETWANNTVSTLEDQAKAPMYGTGPVELGMSNPALGGTPEAISRLQAAVDVDYIGMFAAAFGGDGSAQITDLNIRRAIASFERTIMSGNSYFDRYGRSRDTAVFTNAGLDASKVLNGADIFNNETGDCFHCHGGFNYTDTSFHTSSPGQEYFYHSNGIYSDTDYSGMVANQKGLYSTTGLTQDIGRFRAPSLRNVAVTYPYMHDGNASFQCAGFTVPKSSTDPTYTVPAYSEACARDGLAKVVAHYNSGGKTQQNKDTSLIRALNLTATEQAQLVEFLMSLTDPDFLTNPAFSNPEYGNTNFVSHP